MKPNVNYDTFGFIPCPTCGHDNVDALAWGDPSARADFVVCTVCGTRYNPFTGELSYPF